MSFRNLFLKFVSNFAGGKESRREFREKYIKADNTQEPVAGGLMGEFGGDENNSLNFQMAQLNRIIQDNISTALLHQKVFIPYKNCHTNQDIVLVASGPSVSKYKPIKGAKHIAVNRSFMLDIVNFDYLFIQDYNKPTPEYIDAADNYAPGTCVKFYGLTTEYDKKVNRVIPESHAIRASALRYRTDWADIPYFAPKFAYDISSCPLGCFGSIVFPALQFALWTNPRRIYLVGCDTTNSGYFNSEAVNYLDVDKITETYREFKKFASIYYPHTEIISINPAGLVGVFKDEFSA